MDLLASCDQHYRNLRRRGKHLLRQSSINLATSIITIFMSLVKTNSFWGFFGLVHYNFPFSSSVFLSPAGITAFSFMHAILDFDSTRFYMGCRGVGARLSCANRGTQVCSDPNGGAQSRRQISPNEQYFN